METLKFVLFSIMFRIKYKFSKNPLDNLFYKSFLKKIPLSGKIKLKPMKSIFN